MDKDISQGLKHKFVRNKLTQAWEILNVLEDFEYFDSLKKHFDERIGELMENPDLFKEKIEEKKGEKRKEERKKKEKKEFDISLKDIDEDSSPEEVIRLLKKLVYQDPPYLKLKARLKTIRERTGGERKGWGLGDLEEQINEIKKEKAKKVRWKQDEREETYALFSKSGFTQGLKELAKEEDLQLYNLKRLEKIFS